MHGVFGIVALVGAIYFAFGERTARTVVQIALLLAVAFFLYIGFLVVTDRI